jgi:uncharacterized membrane protein
MGPSLVRRTLAGAAIAWSAALFGAAYLAGQPAEGAASYALALTVYVLGSVLCHQRPERSFHMWTVQLPVCARCTGVYLGAAAAGLAGVRLSSRRAAPLLAALPTVLTLAFEWGTGRTPANWVRAAAGVPLGAVVMMVLLTGLGGTREVN